MNICMTKFKFLGFPGHHWIALSYLGDKSMDRDNLSTWKTLNLTNTNRGSIAQRLVNLYYTAKPQRVEVPRAAVK